MCSAMFVKLTSWYETSKQKNSLLIGKNSIFHSPYGKTAGCYLGVLKYVGKHILEQGKNSR